MSQQIGNPGPAGHMQVIFVWPAILHWLDITLHYNWLTERRIFEIEISVRIHSWLLQETYIAKRKIYCPVGRGCRIHQLRLCRGVRLPNKCPGYDTKQSDSEVQVMLELWGMRCTPLLLSLPGPLRPGVVASDRALYMGWIELNCILMLKWIVWLNWIA